MNENQLSAVASILLDWNPLGSDAKNVKDLDGYRVEAIDIIAGLSLRGSAVKPEKHVMEMSLFSAPRLAEYVRSSRSMDPGETLLIRGRSRSAP